MLNSKTIFKTALVALTANTALFADTKRAELVDVKKINETIQLDLRYATKNNCTRTVISNNQNCYLHKECAESLNTIQQELAFFNLGLKIFEGYRSVSDHKKYKSMTIDDCGCDLPDRHTRGMSVDITLVNLKTNEELPMPTAYDNFCPESSLDNHDKLTQEVFNAILLEEIMTRNGWMACSQAWWHFDWAGWQDYQEVDETL